MTRRSCFGLAAVVGLGALACVGPGEGLSINDNRIVKVDRRLEKPVAERCQKYKSDASLFGPCQSARLEAAAYLKSLDTNAEVCLENTLGEPLNDCYARGRVVDIGPRSVIVSLKEVSSGKAKNFPKTENIFLDNEAFVDLYLAEHGY